MEKALPKINWWPLIFDLIPSWRDTANLETNSLPIQGAKKDLVPPPCIVHRCADGSSRTMPNAFILVMAWIPFLRKQVIPYGQAEPGYKLKTHATKLHARVVIIEMALSLQFTNLFSSGDETGGKDYMCQSLILTIFRGTMLKTEKCQIISIPSICIWGFARTSRQSCWPGIWDPWAPSRTADRVM